MLRTPLVNVRSRRLNQTRHTYSILSNLTMDNELEPQGYLEKPHRPKEPTTLEPKGFGDAPKVEEKKVEEKAPEPVVEEKAPEPVVEEKKPEPKPEPKPAPKPKKKAKTEESPAPPRRVPKTKMVRPTRPTGDSIRGIRRRFS